jgi:hypothetical protein
MLPIKKKKKGDLGGRRNAEGGRLNAESYVPINQEGF